MTSNDNGVYYFLGNISSHVLHALPLYKELGGTFVTTSKSAEMALQQYDIPVVCIDDVPSIWRWEGIRPHRVREYITLDDRFNRTADFLNTHAKVVIFYELFDIADELNLTKPKKVFLTHGNMLKNYFKMHPRRLEIIKQYDYMAALGPIMKDEFIRSGIEKEKLVDIGIARTDEAVALAGKTLLSDKLKNIGVPANKPIISYLPTFWGDSSVGKLGVEILENISDDYTVLFRPHPQTPQGVIKRYKAALARDNIFFVAEKGSSSPSLLDVYAASSALIGDISSVMLEAILLDKPLIFAEQDTLSNTEPHNQLEEIQRFSKKISVSNVSDVNALISESLTTGINEKMWRQSKENSFFYSNGGSTESIAKFVTSVM